MRNPFSPIYLTALIVLTSILLVFVQIGVLSLVFDKLGLSAEQAMLLLLASLFGSLINLPVTTIKAEHADVKIHMNIAHSLLRIHMPPFTGKTVIAVNVGGCLVPLVFSASLINRFPVGVWETAIAITLSSIICYLTSRPIPGMGIAMMPLIAPASAAIIAIIIGGEHAAPLAYIAGTLGVIIGADLMRMKEIAGLGAPIASIGGAGTFDGIFLTGIVAVLLT